MKNYKLSDETKTLPCGTVLHRVVATTTFKVACGMTITEGDVGGWIENESNLSDDAWVIGDAMIYGDALVYDDALVYGDAQIYGDAQVSCNAEVYGNTRVYGNAQVYGDAEVSDHAQVSGDARVFGYAWVSGDVQVSGDAKVSDSAKVYGNAQVSGNAQICGNAEVAGDAKVMSASDYIVFKNNWSSGRYFTWTKSNDKWFVGCFYGTGDELIKKAYADSEDSGKHYEVYVKLVETLKNMEKTE